MKSVMKCLFGSKQNNTPKSKPRQEKNPDGEHDKQLSLSQFLKAF